MNDQPLLIAIVLFLVVNAAVVVFFVMRASGKSPVEQQMRKLADDLGLATVGGEPFFPDISWLAFVKKPIYVEGQQRSRPVRIFHQQRRSGKNTSTYRVIQMTVENPSGLEMAFSRQTIFHRLGKTWGMQDVEVGDREFDDTFMVKCSDPAFVPTALLPEIRAKMLRLYAQQNASGIIELERNRLTYEEIGHFRTSKERERYVLVAEVLADLGDALEVYTSAIHTPLPS